jgi:hypothetical protein
MEQTKKSLSILAHTYPLLAAKLENIVAICSLFGRALLPQLWQDRDHTWGQHGSILKWGYPRFHPFIYIYIIVIEFRGFSIINHVFWGTTIYGNPHMLCC